MDRKPQNKSTSGKRRRRLLAAPFFTVLFVLGVVSFILPLRPAESRIEKRRLTPFPAFSMEALLSGSFFDDINTWYADSFPGREGYLAAARAIDSLHGLNENSVSYQAAPVADEIPVLPVTPPPAPTPVPAPTAAPAAATPEPTPAPTPAPTEEPVLGPPPEESVEHWGGLGDDGDAELYFSSGIQIGDRFFAFYGFSQYLADQYAKNMSAAADWLAEEDIDFYTLLIPSAVGVMVSSDFMEQVHCSDQGAAISYTYAMDGDVIKDVNVFNILVEHNDEYIYFRTDHHWAPLGAYYAYVAFCETAGQTAVPLEDFTEIDMGEFRGSCYYSAAQPSKLTLDNLYAYQPPAEVTMIVTQTPGGSFEWPLITDMTNAAVNAKYMAFLAGDHALCTITNHDMPEDGPCCAVIKDSYGNPFIPFLVANYRTVYVFDLRSWRGVHFRSFIETHRVDDLLLVENLAMAQSEAMQSLIKSFLR